MLPFSNVFTAIGIRVFSLATKLVLQEFSYVLIVICKCKYTLPLFLTIDELALISVAIGINTNSLAL